MTDDSADVIGVGKSQAPQGNRETAEQRDLARRVRELEATVLRPVSSRVRPSLPHLPALDGVRGIAISLVLIHHFLSFKNSTGMAGRWLAELTDSLWIGVDLFFVLSGFLLTRILLSAPKSQGYFYNFYTRRFLRIAPLYFVVTGGFFCMALLKVAPSSLGVPQAPKAYAALALYLTNFATLWWGAGIFGSFFVFWSLATEEQFYLLWPLVTYYNSRRSVAWISAALIPAVVVLRALLWYFHIPPICIYCLSITRLDCLAGGAVSAVLYLSFPARRFETSSWLLIGVSAAGLLFLSSKSHGLPLTDQAVQLVGFPLVAVLMTGFLMLVLGAAPSRPVVRFCLSRPLRLLGKYSYGIYVFHTMALDWVIHYFNAGPGSKAHLIDAVLRPLVGVSLSLAAAWISYNTLEKRMLGLKKVLAPDP